MGRALELGSNVVIDYGLWGRDEGSAPLKNSPKGPIGSTSPRQVNLMAPNLSMNHRPGFRPGKSGVQIDGRQRSADDVLPERQGRDRSSTEGLVPQEQSSPVTGHRSAIPSRAATGYGAIDPGQMRRCTSLRCAIRNARTINSVSLIV